MKTLQNSLPILFILGVVVLFFNKLFLFGLIPFPGDLLLSEYSPWKYSSFFGYNPGSIPNKAQYFDTILQLFPWRSLAIETMMGLRFPLWNPYNFSGSPLLANIQSSVFNPLNILYLFLPKEYAWSVLVMLQPLLASAFMYLFARSITLRKIPAMFTSVSYGFSLYMTVFLQYNTIGHVISFLPLTLFAFEKYRQTKRALFRFLFVLSIALSFFAGHFQLSVVSFCFILVYLLFRLKSQGAFTLINVISFLFFMLLGVSVSAIQLVPAFELISNSARVSQNYQFLIEKLLMQPSQLFMMFVPDIFGNPATRNFLPNETYPTKAAYVGILPLLFAFFSFVSFRRDPLIRFFGLFSFILLVFLIRNPLSEAFYHLNLPLISSSSPSNMWYLFGFCLSVLAGFGMEYVLEKKQFPRKMVILFGELFLSAFAISYLSLNEFIHVKQAALQVVLLVTGIGAVLVLSVKKLPRVLCGSLLIMLTIVDLFYLFQKFNPFSLKESVYPPLAVISFLQKSTGSERVWGVGSAHIQANLHTRLRLYSPEGYDPLYPRQYGEFIHSFERGKLLMDFTSSTRSNASLGEVFGDGKLMENRRRLKLIDFLGVKYILDRVENGNSERSFPSDRFKEVYSENGWKVFENTKSLPRAFLVANAIYATSDEAFEKTFYANDFDPLTSVIVDRPVDVGSQSGQVGKVKLFRYEEDRIHYQTSAENNVIFVLSDTYYPGWKAFIDGEEVEILRANHAFRGVFVPKGTHDITFFYYPTSFIFGIYVSIISSVLLISILMYRTKKTV